MKTRSIAYSLVAAIALVACGQGPNGQAAAQSGDAGSEGAEFAAASGVYTPDPGHRYIVASYLHQGYSRPFIRWNDWDATLTWDAENPENSSITVMIDAASVDSGVARFNEHLQSGDLFDVANHPDITFESTKVVRTGEDTGEVTGDLTILGVTRPVTLDVKFNKAAYVERANVYKMGFSAETTLNRSEFNLGYGVPAVSDEVLLNIEAEFEMAAEGGE